MTARYLTCTLLILCPLSLGSRGANAQEAASYKVEPLAQTAPELVAEPIRAQLSDTALRILDETGEPFIDIWLRKGVPASAKPAGPDGAVQFPVIQVGELVGVAQYHVDGYDYKDQVIIPDVYTMRYGQQPINGDHLGVSTYRDYLMLLIGEEDKALDPQNQEKLDEESSFAAGSNHPAVLLLLNAPDAAEASVVRDEVEDRQGVVLSIPLAVAGSEETTVMKVKLIIVGHGPI